MMTQTNKRSYQAVLDRLCTIKHPKFHFVEEGVKANDPLLTWWSTGKRVHVHLEDDPSEWCVWVMDLSKARMGWKDWPLPEDPDEAEALLREILDSFDGVLDQIIKRIEE